MSKHINEIKVRNPSNDVDIHLIVNGKNIILTGSNGCGKTRVLTKIYEEVCSVVIKREKNLEAIKNEISQNKDWIDQHEISDQHYSHYERSLRNLTEKYENKLKYNIVFHDLNDFMEDYIVF